MVDLNGVTPDFLMFLVESFNGMKGASVLGASLILVQVVIKALNQPFADRFFSKQSGLTKLAIVGVLTFAVTPIGLMSGAGLTLGAALIHSSTLAAFMVFLNELYKHATEKKDGKKL